MRILLAAGLVAATASPALAQSFEGPPAYGEVIWSPGEDPASVVVLAAGAMPADWLDSLCRLYQFSTEHASDPANGRRRLDRGRRR
jgi:hypothetical protein